MHPLFTRTVALAAYMLLWATAGNAFAVLLSLRHDVSPWPAAVLAVTPLSVLYGTACLAAWYVCRAFPVDRATGLARAILAQSAAAALTSAIWVLVGMWWLRLSESVLTPTSVEGLAVWFVAGAFFFLLSSALHYVYEAVEASQQARRQALESAVLAREAELRALRAQVNPHFLFNSLHSIAALAPQRPDDARRMAVGLGEFLRQSLRLGALASVTLEQEVALASEYLAIEQVRFGDRLAVAISVAPDVAGCALPPLLLQPLVENAIKHGVAGLIDGGTVGVTAASDGGQCEVVIRNAYDPDTRPRPGTGTGLVNVRARLATHFGAQGTLDVRMDEALFTVRVRWPMAEPEPARTAEVSA